MNSVLPTLIQLSISGLAGALVLWMAYSEWTGRQLSLTAGFGGILFLLALFLLIELKIQKPKRRVPQRGKS